MSKIKNVLGILFNSTDVYNFYKSIFPFLKIPFEIVVACKSDQETEEVIRLAQEKNFKYSIVNELLKQNIKYQYLLSHHPCELYKELKNLSAFNIRYIYGLGLDKWHFSEWNRHYDLILCFGPYQVKHLHAFENVRKIQIGYPRYDNFFNQNFDYLKLLKNFNCNPDKKTILWLPTAGTSNSLESYAKSIGALTNEYNVIVKPHPYSFTHEKDKTDLLDSLPFSYVIKQKADISELFFIADFVFCDYGGTLFGAIYTDKNLLLLNVNEHIKDSNYSNDSSDVVIREKIINIEPENSHNVLHDILSNHDYWESQLLVRKELRDKFFAPYFGFSSKITANILNNLDLLLDNNSDQVLYNKAITMIKNNKYKEAMPILSTLLEKNYKVPEIFYFTNLCLQNSK
jgi:CDP-glycerol glycerophosphotransferase (TagB/SpsB family)